METLHAMLGARHGDKPAGHWVVATAVISSIKVIAITYACSQKGVSHFISLCGKTKPSDHKCESKFEDEWGNIIFKTILRPEIVHFLCEHCPLMDEHNKTQQSTLALQVRWVTPNPWFRLVTTILGMSVVGMHRMHGHFQLRMNGQDEIDTNHLRTVNLRQPPEMEVHSEKDSSCVARCRQNDGAHSQRNCG